VYGFGELWVVLLAHTTKTSHFVDMLAHVLLLAQLQTAVNVVPPAVHSGREDRTAVRPPRAELPVTIDGVLDEPVWSQAVVLSGFSQFSPVDGVPAHDSTEVLVWYSPTAIHFGIRAFETHGAVHATLADRDRIFADDHVQILLGTFDDGRQATVFAVNPLGVQADGTLVEQGGTRAGSFSAAQVARESADLNPDFVFQSKGRVTERGYEVEVRVPFKTLRYQSRPEQRWGLHILRRVQHSGYEDSWVPAKRDAASFLAQSGHIEGLTGLRRGLVLDLNPEVTARTVGVRGGNGTWSSDAESPEVGGNVRWGITNNLTMNGTVNPDFSQVEADAGQLAFDPRQTLFFAEKRPFFLDGSEQFRTPNNLIYTRRIVQPVGAVKVAGKVSGTDIAFLAAADDELPSTLGHRPRFAIARVQRDVGAQSRVGLAYTDRVVGGDWNRVANADARFVFGTIYDARIQWAQSYTNERGREWNAPLWDARFARNGRRFGMRYSLTGIDPEFVTRSGFISRPGVTNAGFSHRVTTFGARGSAVESFSTELNLLGTWKYDVFTRGGDAQDKKAHLNTTTTFRGGWSLGASLLVETFGYDPDLYADTFIEVPAPVSGLDTIPFTGTPDLPNLDYVLTIGTPEWKHGSASLFVVWGKDENFDEWSSADILIGTLEGDWRPTGKMRVNATYNMQKYNRRTDGSTVRIRRIPRLKLEYQIARPLFVRIVGEYDAQDVDDLRDDSRTGLPLIFRNNDGSFSRATAYSTNVFRGDFLFSYQPLPGTVVFAGYGSVMDEPRAFRFGDLQRNSDGFFVKASYLFRL
jgi:hypothetical protein